MVKTAVILAAGLGSRLKEKTQLKPKGFLEIDGKSLIERSIENLLAVGIEKIYIGTGYLSEVYEEFALNYPQITCIKSDKFKSTSSMYTLYNMKEQIKDNFLLLESDLLYEIDALKELLCDEHKDAILASGATKSGDEVYIDADKSYFLRDMSKDKKKLSFIYGELVGISKISLDRYKMMCKAFEEQENIKIDYEYIMVKTTKNKPFYVKKIKDLIWCEIDNKEHLKRTYKEILPLLNIKEWSKLKVKIQRERKIKTFNERDVVFVNMGQNVGNEQYGKGNMFLRPVLVYKKFNNNQFLGISLTSKEPKNTFYYCKINHYGRVSYANLSQINTYSSKRIEYKLGKALSKNITEVANKLCKILTPQDHSRGEVPNGNNQYIL